MNISQIQKLINGCDGLCIEIAGPSPKGYKFLKKLGLTLPKNILVTNISNPVVLEPFSKNKKIYNVDAVVDITSMPYDRGQLDMLLVSSLPFALRKTLFDSASKVIRAGGLLIIENQLPTDIGFADQTGFRPLLTEDIASKYSSQIYQQRA